MEDFILSKENFGPYIKHLAKSYVERQTVLQWPDATDGVTCDTRQSKNGVIHIRIHIKENLADRTYQIEEMNKFACEMDAFFSKSGLRVSLYNHIY